MSFADIRNRADLAELYCPECTHTIGFGRFLEEYPDRVDVENESIDFGCVECGHDTIEFRRKDPAGSGLTDSVVIARGLNDLERMVGE